MPGEVAALLTRCSSVPKTLRTAARPDARIAKLFLDVGRTIVRRTEQASGSALGCFSAAIGKLSSRVIAMYIAPASSPNVKDEPRRQLARLVRQHEA